ncbi:hypothetical protein [Prevotella koreensis]
MLGNLCSYASHRSSLRSAPIGDAFEAKRRKNAQRSTLIAQLNNLKP